MSNRKPKRQRSKKEWTVLINKFHASGLARKEFCQQNNLSLEYFYRLERNFIKEKNLSNQPFKTQTSFVPIEISRLNVAEKTLPVVQEQAILALLHKSEIKRKNYE